MIIRIERRRRTGHLRTRFASSTRPCAYRTVTGLRSCSPSKRLAEWPLDRGSQYTSQPFQNTLKAYGMNGSMSHTGPDWDHAPTKTGFNRVKHERGHGLHEQYAQR